MTRAGGNCRHRDGRAPVRGWAMKEDVLDLQPVGRAAAGSSIECPRCGAPLIRSGRLAADPSPTGKRTRVHRAPASEFRKNLKDMLNCVHYNGDVVIITSNGKVAAVLVSAEDLCRLNITLPQ